MSTTYKILSLGASYGSLWGTKLALAGNLVMAGAGFLGGHLALNRGTARRAPVEED